MFRYCSNSGQERSRVTAQCLATTPHIPQRYAIDWQRIGDDDENYHGDPKDKRSYYCYGVEARAIADGVVVEVKDGLPDNSPNASRAVPITLETIAGNHVNLDIGGGVYAMYAHLQPGSIRVKLGDKVTPGQLIGLVGNSGNSSVPHLHVQLMNRNSPLASEGLPYSLPAFKVTGAHVATCQPSIICRAGNPSRRYPAGKRGRGLRATGLPTRKMD